ncbi:hypothetical protein ARMA_1286 [Ardenticatena maritima]|uniref:Uncharacterized protein n=1 Tax=Ardenticatena maritima TaxID=872965 RepID=A0A0M8K6L6_9CHLR|nr:hypothetical protein ARMA_1286 [Ardenticatena maritima]
MVLEAACVKGVENVSRENSQSTLNNISICLKKGSDFIIHPLLCVIHCRAGGMSSRSKSASDTA